MTEKYKRCFVMSGGGFRFGYYLGAHAALVQRGCAPDILLASCGGAIAAAIIQGSDDDQQALQWLASPAMHRFFRQLTSRRGATLTGALLAAVGRRLATGRATRIPDLFADYLFEVPAQLPLPRRRPAANATNATNDPKGSKDSSDSKGPNDRSEPNNPSRPALAIIAGRLLYDADQVGQPRASRKLYEETIFCDQRGADLLRGHASPWRDPRWGDHAVAPSLRIDTTTPIADAVRASLADMYYFRAHEHSSGRYTGGAIDLMPIEIARGLADQVIMENKGSYDPLLARPALRAVFGFDAEQRLREVMREPVDLRIDTADMSRALATQVIRKHLDWRRNRIELITPDSPDDYQRMIEAQWAYGFARGSQARADSRA